MSKNNIYLLGLAILFVFGIGFAYAEAAKRIPARDGHTTRSSHIARMAHSAIYDSKNNQMIIFGGWKQPGPLSDIWTFDIEKKKWEEIETDETPTARMQHTAIYDSINKQMIILGGTGPTGYLSDIWVFNIEKKTWEEIDTDEALSARYVHTAVYDSENKQMIIFGGIGPTGYLSDTWVFNIEKKKWEEIDTDETPPARSEHSAIYDSVNKQMIIFGGGGPGGNLSDTWIFDIEKKMWKEIEIDETPTARWGHSAIYDSVNKQMIIFAGIGPTGDLSDTWAFDIEKKTWEEIETKKAPPARHDHSAIYDSVNKQMIIFAGTGNLAQFQSDIWAFDIENKKWKQIKKRS